MHIRDAQLFSDATELEKLPGGQEGSYRAGDVVLKPVESVTKYLWLADILDPLEIPGLRIAKPVRSRNGKWMENGLGATRFSPGVFVEGRMEEKLNAAIDFHLPLRAVPKPKNFDYWSDPWALAHKFAWAELPLPRNTDEQIAGVVAKITALRKPLKLQDQLIHGDLAGNLLFDGKTPVIIDISPDYRPLEYALAVLVCDSIAWHNEPLDSLKLLDFEPSVRTQLVIRAVLFRLSVLVFLDPENRGAFAAELEKFKPILAYKTTAN